MCPGAAARLSGRAGRRLEPTCGRWRNWAAVSTRRAITLEQGTLPSNGLVVYVIRAATLYDRPGNPYLNDEHVPYGDNAQRFALLGWVAAQLAQRLDSAWSPQIVHAHDWHAGLAPAYLKAAERQHGRVFARSVFTVHNLAYQGVFPAHQFGQLALPDDFSSACTASNSMGSCRVPRGRPTTATASPPISPDLRPRNPDTRPGAAGSTRLLRQLARSERHPEWRRLLGVESRHRHAPRRPLHGHPSGRQTGLQGQRCRSALACAEKAMRWLFGVVSRLAEQEGLDLLLEMIPEIVKRGGQLVVFGTGDPALGNRFETRRAGASGIGPRGRTRVSTKH